MGNVFFGSPGIIVSTFFLSTKINYLLVEKASNWGVLQLYFTHIIFHIFYYQSMGNEDKKSLNSSWNDTEWLKMILLVCQIMRRKILYYTCHNHAQNQIINFYFVWFLSYLPSKYWDIYFQENIRHIIIKNHKVINDSSY